MRDPLEKFSNNFKQALKTAAALAVELHHTIIEPEHILYGLIYQQGSVGAEIFTALKIKSEDIKNSIAKIDHKHEQVATKTTPKFSDNAKSVIQKSIQISYINEHHYIGTEHLLAALLQTSNTQVDKVFKMIGVSEESIAQQVAGVLKSASKLPDLTETFKVSSDNQIREDIDEEAEIEEEKITPSVLDAFGVNLTSKKFQKNIDPVIGRGDEIDRIIQILSRRTKNNPILLGEPGVGKTAIIEGLAKRILSGDVPDILKNKKIYAIDLTATVAGTMYRGEFENRLKQIIDETKRRPEVILFIDEIHNIVGAGSASGSMDAANILKPALARGEINCIGATTYNDYRKTIESDPALERRFQVVRITEPTAEQTKLIISGIKKYFENFHRVTITEEAIDAAISLSQRYLPEKFLPDKAIDLIDEAAAAIKIKRKLSQQEVEINTTNKQIGDIKRQTQKAIFQGDYELAMRLRQESEKISEKIKPIAEKQVRASHERIGEITEHDVARVITKMTGIPAEDLVLSERKKIINLGKKLSQKIIGQDQAIATIADFIKRSKAGLTSPQKPLASFIFVGPSGVGKTYTARALAESLFNDAKSFIKIDMSEYSEKFNMSKLIGAPAGYVGYKESGQLTEKIKHKPYSVVLLDEIEKANRDIFDLLLQVLEDGYLTDAAGSRINFQNTIIIMTSNIGSQNFQKGKNLGFGENEGLNPKSIEEKVLDETKNYFKPEFLNRVDRVIYFNSLSEPDLEKITKLELAKLEKRVSEKKIAMTFSLPVIKHIVTSSNGKNEGARSIQKTIQNLIESPLADRLLSEEITAGTSVQISLKNGIIEIERV